MQLDYESSIFRTLAESSIALLCWLNTLIATKQYELVADPRLQIYHIP
jgi:hypothetical protein